ncbi:polysaccharide deacetylase family protein [Bacillus sp. AFS017336]|uniref:polysaccharide deacetylase family protein n=1 Tax=Bacillus sp. AFS017336 TaxID=2033489 RepID=UPI000BF16A64|nr:polysaccharide deacetylase family protein [Bacillus sp. AFS017336]PEL07807.1 polysaccharide deacetylase family protein [Bacillus sp. AFS017336]
MVRFFITIGSLLLVLFLFYGPIPSLLTRLFNLFSINQVSNRKKQIALTFDDGPHPVYTSLLLDLLRSHSIKATFFVLGSEAEKHPAIIKRIHEEGHLLAIHNYKHNCNWFLSPNSLKNQIDKTADIIKNLTNYDPIYYRPPWGLVSLPLLFQRKYRLILWSVMANDWSSKHGSQGILNRLVKQTKAGSIVLLHDNGDTVGADEDAPSYTIKALESYILQCFENQYEFVLINE